MPDLSRLQPLKEVPYPTPPWKMKGQLWMGLFKADRPIPLPAGLKSLLDPHSLLVVLVRYLEGTLCYDELAFGTLMRFGARVGVYVDYIWVNEPASVWGGRRVWGLPKNLAEFTWQESTVRVADEQGAIATVQVDRSPGQVPWLWMPMPGIGQLENGRWAFTVWSVWLRLGRVGMQIEAWTDRFEYRPTDKATFGLAGKPFRMKVPAAHVLRRF